MAMTKEELQNLSDEQEVMYIEVKDPVTGLTCTNWINWKEYRIQANFYAKLQGRPVPYPEIESAPRPEHPISGKGLLEQLDSYTGRYEKLSYKQLKNKLKDVFYGRK